MAKRKKDKKGEGHVQLPRDALTRVALGQSFAEYDRILQKPQVFVKTPAAEAALDSSTGKCFYIGRRGTGKTAITLFVHAHKPDTVQILPQAFVPLGLNITGEFKDTRQRPFKSLVHAFKRAIQDEAIALWISKKKLNVTKFGRVLQQELQFLGEDFDFDLRASLFLRDILASLNANDEREWLSKINRDKEVRKELEQLDASRSGSLNCTLLIDRIDESWDGSEGAVIVLMALMHACVELAQSDIVCPLLFLRENMFERVRIMDNEFARLETAVVSLDWTPALLVEMVERRLNHPFNTKLRLNGPTWDYFFEFVDGKSSSDQVLEFCQHRPRDVLIYCGFAVESAKASGHEQVKIEDLQAAQKRFSDSRLKDLGDEYAENYPEIRLVLERFHGLGRRFTVPGLVDLMKKLLSDADVRKYCKSWLFRHTSPEQFIELLYNIGFVGVSNGGREPQFRTLGAKSSTAPAISASAEVVVHPSYAKALSLQEVVVTHLPEEAPLQRDGLLPDLPDMVSLADYHDRLDELQVNLDSLPEGTANAAEFEDLVGDIIQLCFFRWLNNVAPHVRDIEGRVIRDWIAANVANGGFWEMVRQRYEATQVIWECKNYAKLKAADFQQVSYYQNNAIGRFVIIAYRGVDIEKRCYEHIRRIIQDRDGMVLLLTQRDLHVLIRQAKAGKVSEGHIREIYDQTVRKCS